MKPNFALKHLRNNLLLVIAVSFSQGAFSQGFLKANGEKIVNENGENIILCGMGLGGWMLQEGYMFKVGELGRQDRIKEEITKLVGTQKADEFYKLCLQNNTSKLILILWLHGVLIL